MPSLASRSDTLDGDCCGRPAGAGPDQASVRSRPRSRAAAVVFIQKLVARKQPPASCSRLEPEPVGQLPFADSLLTANESRSGAAGNLWLECESNLFDFVAVASRSRRLADNGPSHCLSPSASAIVSHSRRDSFEKAASSTILITTSRGRDVMWHSLAYRGP